MQTTIQRRLRRSAEQRLYVRIAVFLCLLFSYRTVTAEEPPVNYEDPGVCPFECCEYRNWTANADTEIYKGRDSTSEVIFHVSKSEVIRGLTGIVITITPGKAIVKKAITLGQDDQVNAKAGDVLYLLHYEGEGIVKFWLHGKVYSDELPFVGDSDDHIETQSEPKTVWWVQVKNKKGQIGWTKETDHFDHMDSCE